MNINEVLNIKYPIIQGGMAHITRGEFAAKISNLGALGVIGSGGMDKEELREEIRICKSMTDKPFGVNLLMLNPDIDSMADLVIEEEVPVVTVGAGNPRKYIKAWKEAGIIVMPVVSSPDLAVLMERAGADAVIAEGSEAGGHIGELNTMTLIPQVVEAVKIPVVGAGGIATGGQMKAMEILGASGVQIGTRFLATEECPIHDNYKNSIVKAKSNQVVVLGRLIGMPIRVLRNSMTMEYLKVEKSGASLEELEKFTLGALRSAIRDGDVKNGSLMAGQVAGQIKEILPVEDLLVRLMEEYKAI